METLSFLIHHTQVLRPNVLLLDMGNLVIKEGTENSQTFFWQSFDYPTHFLLPDMKLGWKLSTDHHGFPEIFLRDKHVKNFQTGPWNGMIFSGVPEMCASKHGVISTSLRNKMRSNIQAWQLHGLRAQICEIYFSIPKRTNVTAMESVVPFGICDTNASPVCKCARGFQPKNLEAWNLGNGFDGCVRKRELKFTKDKFLRLRSVKLPKSGGAFVDGDMSLEACKEKCLENCTCTAYCDMEISNGGPSCPLAPQTT
ncbi:hypothetical protein PRUPE_4G019300 [Prunus persica]|uniref:Apple domain-containing protein n=1 Tax=Prunus persica TaxID=3760 RepID=A0A251PEC6_PRUPE|nr:hypothetical protein PRUPE_4G019300 [Prunus persica]